MNRTTLTTILVIIVLALVGAVGYTFVKKGDLIPARGLVKDSGDNISDYSAIFLTNGQVYFGKLYNTSGDVDLRDIFYLQVNQQIQPNQQTQGQQQQQSTDQPNIVLVKLGDELHGPNDRMVINKDQVLFTESLKKDSKVVTAINDYKAGKR